MQVIAGRIRLTANKTVAIKSVQIDNKPVILKSLKYIPIRIVYSVYILFFHDDDSLLIKLKLLIKVCGIDCFQSARAFIFDTRLLWKIQIWKCRTLRCEWSNYYWWTMTTFVVKNDFLIHSFYEAKWNGGSCESFQYFRTIFTPALYRIAGNAFEIYFP